MTGHVTIPFLEPPLRYFGPHSPRASPKQSRRSKAPSIVLHRHEVVAKVHVLLLNIVNISVVYSVTCSWHGAYINTEGEPFDLEDSQLCHNLSLSPNIYYYKTNSTTVQKQMPIGCRHALAQPNNHNGFVLPAR
jgi:hypothetical protein